MAEPRPRAAASGRRSSCHATATTGLASDAMARSGHAHGPIAYAPAQDGPSMGTVARLGSSSTAYGHGRGYVTSLNWSRMPSAGLA